LRIIEELHKSSIRVSDIASQYWCERQMEYNYRYGKKITAEIREGRVLHEELEGEVNVPIILQPKSYADALYKGLYTSYMALEALKKNRKTREVQIYGSISGYKVVGKIDQLEIKGDKVTILEDKTRANHNIPSDRQKITHKVQIMVYKKLADDVAGGEYTAENFTNAYRTSTLALTSEFVRQLEALGIDREMQKVNSVAGHFFQELKSLKETSSTLYIRYIDQFTGKEIDTYKFEYDESEMQGIINYVMKYWNGERKAMPVPEEEKWKCSYCMFFGKECKAWWPQQVL
jgi:exonuclease V